MVLENKKDSIYIQLLRLLVFSAVLAGFLFLALNNGVDRLIENYYYSTDYEKAKDEAYLSKLQNYINENGLSSRDTAELSKWVKKQKILVLQVYMDNKKIFDSDYPDKQFWEEDIESNEYEWETYYSIEFSDGSARVGIIGMYEYQLYNYALIAELLLSFIAFLVLVLLGIRKKMKYISELSEEIAILEGGSLDYAITVKGRDELTVLAEGLENMRVSFRKMMEQEEEMVRENNKIITEMSHDLRTPITSILLYTEILKKGNDRMENQWSECVEKIDKKAHRMKQLTDHLFEYVLVSGGRKIELEEPESVEILFYDLLSETCSYLSQNGFEVESRVEWADRKVCVCTEYIVRIMDNISSNIIKYADPQEKVIISSVYREHALGFRFENKEAEKKENRDSNGVGIQSIKNMMKKMHGECLVSMEKNTFGIEIIFPSAE